METLILAVFLAAIGGIATVVGGLEEWKIATLFRKTPARPVAETAGDGLVRIRGKVRPGELGLLRVPLLNHQVVWYSLEVFEPQAGVSSRPARRILSMSDGLAFLVDDGSGQCALVRPHGAVFLVATQIVASCGSCDEISHELDTFLASKGIGARTKPGYNKAIQCRLQCVGPDDIVHVLGPSERPGFGHFFGMSRSSQLVLSTDEKRKEPLYISNQSEAKLTGIPWLFLVGVLFLCAGVLILLVEFVVPCTLSALKD